MLQANGLSHSADFAILTLPELGEISNRARGISAAEAQARAEVSYICQYF